MEYLICLHETKGKTIGYTAINIPEDIRMIQTHTYNMNSPRKLDNAKVSLKGVETTNGAVTRYPIVKDGKLKNKNSYILLGYYDQDNDKVYVYCDYTGQLYKNKAQQLVNTNFANAKVVNNNGLFIAFISGECPKINITVKQNKEEVTTTTTSKSLTNEQLKEVLTKAKPKNSQFLIETGNIPELVGSYVENIKQYVKDNSIIADLTQKLLATSYKPIKVEAPAISKELKNKNFSYSMLGA